MEEKVALDWQAQNFRLSIFLGTTHQVEESDWVVISGGKKPENTIGQNNIKHIWGAALGGALRISSQPARIDIILIPSTPAVPTRLDDLLYVGEFFSHIEVFRQATKKWLDNISFDILRIAFGSMIISPHKSMEATYTTVRRMLKSVRLDSGNAKDVSFSINWLTRSEKSNETLLNRVTKFSSVAFQSQLTVGVPGFPMANLPGALRSESLPAVYAATLEIDHSSDAERSTPLPRERIVAIYEELLNLAIENAKMGEVPCP
jgi:hypothetical protein